MPSVVVLSLALSPLIYLTGRWLASAARIAALGGLALLWLFFALLLREFASAGVVSGAQGLVPFSVDGLSLLFTAAALLVSTLVILFSGLDMRGRAGEEKYYAMLFLMTGAVIALVSARDLFNLWVWFELTAVSSYLLVAFYRERAASLAACAKYLIQTSAGSILVLFGIALVFADSGTLDLAGLDLPASPLAVVAGTLFLIGFGVKIGLVPTYTWLPDAYSQAPTGVSAALSGFATVSGLAALLRALGALGGLENAWGAALIAFGIANIVTGNLLALSQTEVKRIFAYSSISHIGFMLLAVGIGVYTGERAGFQGGMLHLFVHGLMKVLAFLAAGAVIYTRGRATAPLQIVDLAGVARREPLLAAALITACLSLAGVPPLAGFMSKLQVFAAGIDSQSMIVILLTLFAALNSVFSLAYYFPIINALFRPEVDPPRRPLAASMSIPILALTGALLVIGLYPVLLDGLVIPAAEALTALFGGRP